MHTVTGELFTTAEEDEDLLDAAMSDYLMPSNAEQRAQNKNLSRKYRETEASLLNKISTLNTGTKTKHQNYKK